MIVIPALEVGDMLVSGTHWPASLIWEISGYAGCQPSYRLTERHCLKEIQQGVVEWDTQHPPLDSTCPQMRACTHTHVHTSHIHARMHTGTCVRTHTHTNTAVTMHLDSQTSSQWFP